MVKIYNAACQLMSTLELDNGGRGDKIDDPDELRLSGACKGKLAEGNDKPVYASCVCVCVLCVCKRMCLYGSCSGDKTRSQIHTEHPPLTPTTPPRFPSTSTPPTSLSSFHTYTHTLSQPSAARTSPLAPPPVTPARVPSLPSPPPTPRYPSGM